MCRHLHHFEDLVHGITLNQKNTRIRDAVSEPTLWKQCHACLSRHQNALIQVLSLVKQQGAFSVFDAILLAVFCCIQRDDAIIFWIIITMNQEIVVVFQFRILFVIKLCDVLC